MHIGWYALVKMYQPFTIHSYARKSTPPSVPSSWSKILVSKVSPGLHPGLFSLTSFSMLKAYSPAVLSNVHEAELRCFEGMVLKYLLITSFLLVPCGILFPLVLIKSCFTTSAKSAFTSSDTGTIFFQPLLPVTHLSACSFDIQGTPFSS